MFIYVKVGVVVFKWRKQLLSLSRSEHKPEAPPAGYAMGELSSPISPSSPPPKTYEVTISSQVPHSSRRERQLSSPRNTYYGATTPVDAHHQRFSSIQETAYPDTANTQVVVERPKIKTLDANKATLSYCKTAMLFFIALLCTWYVSVLALL
jgi:hypothetical protein